MIINLSRKISNLLDNCQKFAHTLSWNACTWHEFDDLTFLWSVNKLARSATKMDSSMWPTISEADFLHSSHKRFPTILSCGKHGPALQTGFVSRLRLCWWSWRLNINLWWSLVSFWKYNISSSQLDVQETDCCLAQFYKVWDYFSGCRIAYGWVTCSWFLGHGDWSSTLDQQQCPTQTYTHSGNWCDSSFQNQGPESQKKTEGWSIEWCG